MPSDRTPGQTLAALLFLLLGCALIAANLFRLDPWPAAWIALALYPLVSVILRLTLGDWVWENLWRGGFSVPLVAWIAIIALLLMAMRERLSISVWFSAAGLVFAILFGAVGYLIEIGSPDEGRSRTASGGLGIGAVYGLGVLSTLNLTLDFAPADRTLYFLADKAYVPGKGGGYRAELLRDAYAGRRRVWLRRDQYDALPAPPPLSRDLPPVWVIDHPGLFQLGWTEVLVGNQPPLRERWWTWKPPRLTVEPGGAKS